MVLALLEVEQLVSNAFLDEDTPGVLLNNRFLVLLSDALADTLSDLMVLCRAYLENGVFDLLRFTRLNLFGRLVPDVLKLRLIVCYPLF